MDLLAGDDVVVISAGNGSLVGGNEIVRGPMDHSPRILHHALASPDGSPLPPPPPPHLLHGGGPGAGLGAVTSYAMLLEDALRSDDDSSIAF